MRITVDGHAYSGKSTLATALADYLGIAHHSAGGFNRQLAKESGLTLDEFDELAKTDPSIDKKVDAATVEFGKKHDRFVLEGRTTGLFIPHADIKLFVTCSLEEAVSRLKQGGHRFNEIKDFREDPLNYLERRRQRDRERYLNSYDFVYDDPAHFDLVIDTTGIELAQEIEMVITYGIEHNILERRGEQYAAVRA